MSEPSDQHQTLTFVVRLWREANACGQKHWCGMVENVGTQEVGYVDDVAAIVGVMERWTTMREEPTTGESVARERRAE